MALTKRKELDQIILNPVTGSVSWRETTIIEEDGIELVQQFHRGSVEVDSPAPATMPAAIAQFRALVDTPQARAKTQELRTKTKAR